MPEYGIAARTEGKPAVRDIAVVQIGIFLCTRKISGGLGFVRMRLHPFGQLIHARLGGDKLGVRRIHLLAHRAAAAVGKLEGAVLRQNADSRVLIYINAARRRLCPAEQERKERRFAAAVRPDDAETVVFVKGKGHVLQYFLRTEGKRNIVYAEYGHVVPSNNNSVFRALSLSRTPHRVCAPRRSQNLRLTAVSACNRGFRA